MRTHESNGECQEEGAVACADGRQDKATIRLRGTDGTERCTNLTGVDLKVCVGDMLTIIWGNLEGGRDGPFWHVDNHTRNCTCAFLDGAPFRAGWTPPSYPRGYVAYLFASTTFLYLLANYPETANPNLDWILWALLLLAFISVERRKFVKRCKREIRHFLAFIVAQDKGLYPPPVGI